MPHCYDTYPFRGLKELQDISNIYLLFSSAESLFEHPLDNLINSESFSTVLCHSPMLSAS